MPFYFRLSLTTKGGAFYSTPRMVLAENKKEAARKIFRKYGNDKNKWTGFDWF